MTPDAIKLMIEAAMLLLAASGAVWGVKLQMAVVLVRLKAVELSVEGIKGLVTNNAVLHERISNLRRDVELLKRGKGLIVDDDLPSLRE